MSSAVGLNWQGLYEYRPYWDGEAPAPSRRASIQVETNRMNEKLPAPCETCRGSGSHRGSVCGECQGKGYRLFVSGNQIPVRQENPQRRRGKRLLQRHRQAAGQAVPARSHCPLGLRRMPVNILEPPGTCAAGLFGKYAQLSHFVWANVQHRGFFEGQSLPCETHHPSRRQVLSKYLQTSYTWSTNGP